MKHLGWLHQIQVRPLSRSGGFVALTAVSLLAHGVVLGLPWSETEPTSELPPPESSAAAVMEVAILPSAPLEQPDQATSRPSTPTPTQELPPEAPSSEPLGQRSPPSPSEKPQRSSAPPPPEPMPPSSPPEDTLPPLPEEEETEADPIADLPIAEGTETSPPNSEPPSPPTLEEQLQDATAYQYDGRKSLKQAEAYQVSANWVAAGQVLPENVAPLELPYQLGDTCLDTPPESGLLAVVLDAAGNFVRGPEVIDSTGYSLLDDQAVAIAAAGDHAFPERTEPRGYVAEIVVQYPAACL